MSSTSRSHDPQSTVVHPLTSALAATPVVRVDPLRDHPLGCRERPSWRGRLHLLALWCVVPMLVVLAVGADGARARAGVIVYGVGLCAMFAVSTVYHRFVHTVRARSAWRRADHATIFAAIGGTFTAIALTTLDTVPATALLIPLWAVAGFGAIAKALDVRHADRIGAILYLGIGWAGVVLAPAVWQHGGPLAVVLLVAGGVLYTVGATGFSRGWPQLRPATFSYHEVWHAFTIAAAGLHLAAVWTVAT